MYNGSMAKTLFYTYIIRDPRTFDPIYVGKGKKRRMYVHWDLMKNRVNEGCNPHFYRRLTQIFREGFTAPIYEKVLECSDEKACTLLEIFLIRSIGREDLGIGPLLNLTDGGEGAYNISSEAASARSRKAAQSIGPERRRELALSRAEALGTEWYRQLAFKRNRDQGPEGIAKRIAQMLVTKGPEGLRMCGVKSGETLGKEGCEARSAKAMETMGKDGLSARASKRAKNLGKDRLNEIAAKGAATREANGYVPWNKGTKGLQVAWNKGKKYKRRWKHGPTKLTGSEIAKKGHLTRRNKLWASLASGD